MMETTLEDKKITRLYELLEELEKKHTNKAKEQAAALKWAIFVVEQTIHT